MAVINLKDKVALVTAGSDYFGKGICSALVDAGAEVWVHCFDINRNAEELVESLNKNGRKAHLIYGNLENPEEVKALISKVFNESGKIDILINNAQHQSFSTFKDIKPEEWLSTFTRNIDVPFLCSKEVLPLMVKEGEGYLINISSTAAITGDVGAHFAASKSALNSMTKGLSREFKKHGIRVNGIAPTVAENQEELCKAVSNMVLILCSPFGSYINGDTILLDGGESIA